MLKQINISELVNGNRGVYNLYRCVWHLVNNTKQANNKDNTYLYKNGLLLISQNLRGEPSLAD